MTHHPCIFTNSITALQHDEPTTQHDSNARSATIPPVRQATTRKGISMKQVLLDCLCFRCCFPNDQSRDSYLQPLNIFQPKSNTTVEELLEQSSAAREAMWKKVGTLEPMVLSHQVNPVATGGPKWPAHRQAFRVVKRPNGNVILASDGLSDPFDDIGAEGAVVWMTMTSIAVHTCRRRQRQRLWTRILY